MKIINMKLSLELLSSLIRIWFSLDKFHIAGPFGLMKTSLTKKTVYIKSSLKKNLKAQKLSAVQQ
jgi:hypothetical protein